jgi:hypothetical protein
MDLAARSDCPQDASGQGGSRPQPNGLRAVSGPLERTMARKQTATLGKFKLTARTDAPDFRDYAYRPALVNLEPSIEVPENLNIRNQGSSKACTGFGLAAVVDRSIAESERMVQDVFRTFRFE